MVLNVSIPYDLTADWVYLAITQNRKQVNQRRTYLSVEGMLKNLKIW
jgi:hypothetical protein